MKRENRRLTREEFASIISSRPVVRRPIGPGRGESSGRHENLNPPDAPKKFYPNRKHMFVPSKGGSMWTNVNAKERKGVST